MVGALYQYCVSPRQHLGAGRGGGVGRPVPHNGLKRARGLMAIADGWTGHSDPGVCDPTAPTGAEARLLRCGPVRDGIEAATI